MISVGAILLVLSVLFAAPLVLGSYIVVQRARPITQMIWFALVSGLLLAVFIMGALTLALAAR